MFNEVLVIYKVKYLYDIKQWLCTKNVMFVYLNMKQ